MAGPLSRTFIWRFDAAPAEIWPHLADTARFNEAAGLPKQEIDEQPQPDGSVHYFARAKKGPFALEWQEKPVNWVAGKWFEHCRDFHKGPLKTLCASFTLKPRGTGSEGHYTITAEAANLVGRLILKFGFFDGAGRSFGKLAQTADRCAVGERATPFDYTPPPPPAGLGARPAEMTDVIERSGHGHGLAARLAEHLLSAQEVDITQVRPLRLARDWGVAARRTIELCLEATRAGLLELRWDLLCPRCRIAKAVVGSLDELPQGAHCSTCNIDYDRDFSQNVELSFRPAPAVRPLTMGEYCLFGPMNTPHILVHLTLEPGECRSLELDLAPGPYRVRTLEPGPELGLEATAGGFPEAVVSDDAVTAGEVVPAGQVRLKNASRRPLTLVVEERAWVRDALTADRVSTLQTFRDLFSDQVLRPGDEVAVRRVALLFTDLRGSTALYGQAGDADAYHLVREHFAFLAAIVRAHDGAIVKTIGDAIMAAFADPGDALKAALSVQRQVATFNAGHGKAPLVLKLGLHDGPCIAVTLNDRLDYFGTTVNLSARLQAESRGGDIVVSRQMADDPAVAALLDGVSSREERADLKGFEEAVEFLRLAP
jgi:class 3 adenylate cyclase